MERGVPLSAPGWAWPVTGHVEVLPCRSASSGSRFRSTTQQNPGGRATPTSGLRVSSLSVSLWAGVSLRQRSWKHGGVEVRRRAVTNLKKSSVEQDGFSYNPSAFKDAKAPSLSDFEKIDDDGVKWVLVKTSCVYSWQRDDEVGSTRLTPAGYLARNEDGNWTHQAAIPADITHLNPEQQERLRKELKGEVQISLPIGEGEPFEAKNKVPPFEEWPFHSAAITDEACVTEAELEDYSTIDFSEELPRVFCLVQRWKGVHESRRALGYSVNDDMGAMVNISSSVSALRTLQDVLRRLALFRKYPERRDGSKDARFEALRFHALVGSTKGSAIAMWSFIRTRKALKVDFCIGNDCTNSGPVAEEALVKSLFKMGKEMGAEVLYFRLRLSESGREHIPSFMQQLGFAPAPELDDLDEERLEADVVEVPIALRAEAVSGLSLWLGTRGLNRVLDDANRWCKEMGAADLAEVTENKEELADFLGDDLTSEERERLLAF